MIWINRLLLLFLIFPCLYGRELSVKDSYDALFHSSGPVRATLHINNLIRQGAIGLTDFEKGRLTEIGLSIHGNEIIILKSTDLDHTLDTDHFRFYYTLDESSNDVVENEDYVTNMSVVFEEVWTFYIDSMGFEPPPLNPNNDHDLYEIYIEYLSPAYFGLTFGQGSGESCYGFIKMRNSYKASQFSDHTVLENIQVTAVHEFFHSIQFGYNCYEKFWFMEASATWSEDELYDNINDFYRYIPNFFSNPNHAIGTEGTFMYGTCIFFQYIDEHLGGRETIRKSWEYSRDYASPLNDISFLAIDAALRQNNFSFEIAYNQMRIANQILSSSENAGVYSYEEADGYLTVVSPPPKEDYFFFEKGDIESIEKFSLQLYESHYYSITTETPVSLSLTKVNGEFSFTSIVKMSDADQWVVKSGLEQNIDPKIGIEWITLIVSALGENGNDWDYSLSLSDGYSEDFTFYPPYPNPSIGQSINFEFQVINEQTIDFQIVDILGQNIWQFSNHYSKPEVITIKWDGKNKSGQRVANGVYFGIMEGNSEKKVFKITYLKKSN
tara:strand:- start:775 stop:2433 length:1659 start_codon:yes stop_codon:yes gene_type:complete